VVRSAFALVGAVQPAPGHVISEYVRLEAQQHAGVAESVGFYPLQVEKVRDAIVIRPQ
jgi:hypothetical protein